MAICRTCGGAFHHCPICLTKFQWEYYYCSSKCWVNSDEYKKIKKELSPIIDSLSVDQIEELISYLKEC